MRWLFPDLTDRAEAAARQAVIAKIDSWWRAFAAHADRIGAGFSKGADPQLPEFMRQHLDPVDPNLAWEFGPAVKQEGHRLCVTAEGRASATPLLNVLIERAPEIAGWEFYAHKLPDTVDHAISVASQITGFQPKAPASVSLTLNEQNRIDLTFDVPRGAGTSDDQALGFAFKVTEHVVGDEVIDRWVGAFEMTKPTGTIAKLFGRGTPRGMLPLDRLKPTLDALIESTKEQLPPAPRYTVAAQARAADNWSMFNIQPQPPGADDDFPGTSDQIFLMSWDGTSAIACRSPGFSSERFSRVGERFAYLKLEHGAVESDTLSDWRGDLEEAIDAALIAKRLGCATGGGAGLRYAYIDLVLTDVAAAATVIKDIVSGWPGASTRSWLEFYDRELGEEWIGLVPGAPTPPRSAEEDGNS